MSSISLIAALSEDNVIGRDNKLPWHQKSDLANFRRLTLDKPVIMGRKTFESLGRPLDRRPNIVVTRDPSFTFPGISVFGSVEEAIEFAIEIPADEIMVIGGEQIFCSTLHTANRMYLTLIHTIVGDGDAFFPHYDRDEWNTVEDRMLPVSADEFPAEFKILERNRPKAA